MIAPEFLNHRVENVGDTYELSENEKIVLQIRKINFEVEIDEIREDLFSETNIDKEAQREAFDGMTVEELIEKGIVVLG